MVTIRPFLCCVDTMLPVLSNCSRRRNKGWLQRQRVLLKMRDSQQWGNQQMPRKVFSKQKEFNTRFFFHLYSNHSTNVKSHNTFFFPQTSVPSKSTNSTIYLDTDRAPDAHGVHVSPPATLTQTSRRHTSTPSQLQQPKPNLTKNTKHKHTPRTHHAQTPSLNPPTPCSSFRAPSAHQTACLVQRKGSLARAAERLSAGGTQRLERRRPVKECLGDVLGSKLGGVGWGEGDAGIRRTRGEGEGGIFCSERLN
jgi:hypothetical protein